MPFPSGHHADRRPVECAGLHGTLDVDLVPKQPDRLIGRIR
jgi:hypothetical protein